MENYIEENKMVHSDPERMDGGPVPAWKCPLCGEDTTSLEFTTHLRNHNEVRPIPDTSDPTGEAKMFHCCLCGKMLFSFSSLDHHMRIHSGERSWVLEDEDDNCSMSAGTSPGTSPDTSEHCRKILFSSSSLDRHMRVHSGQRPGYLEDDNCSMSPGQIPESEDEIRVQSGERSVWLEDEDGNCSMSSGTSPGTSPSTSPDTSPGTSPDTSPGTSPDKSDPTGEVKLFHCCVCGKILFSFCSLDRHMRVHYGELPWYLEDYNPEMMSTMAPRSQPVDALTKPQPPDEDLAEVQSILSIAQKRIKGASMNQ